MKELSVFVDESGDIGGESDYYLIALVFHDQDDNIQASIARYRQALSDRSIADATFHLGPLLHAHDDYRHMDVRQRKLILGAFQVFASHSPFTYHVFAYQKSRFENIDALATRLRRDLVEYLFDHLDAFQQFDAIKIYYDDGQPFVTRILHAAFEYAVAKNTIVYRDAKPCDYRLLQIADYACGIELAAIKYLQHAESATERIFFGKWTDFKRGHLKKLRSHLL